MYIFILRLCLFLKCCNSTTSMASSKFARFLCPVPTCKNICDSEGYDVGPADLADDCGHREKRRTSHLYGQPEAEGEQDRHHASQYVTGDQGQLHLVDRPEVQHCNPRVVVRMLGSLPSPICDVSPPCGYVSSGNVTCGISCKT